MEKSLFYKYKNIIEIFTATAIIGMSICIVFASQYVKVWNSELETILKYMSVYNNYRGWFRKILIKNLKYLGFVAIICKSVYRHFLKYGLAIYLGFSTLFLVTVFIMAKNIKLGLIILLICFVKIVFNSFAAFLLYVKKRQNKYLFSFGVILLQSMLEAMIYTKMVARLVII